MNQLIPVINKLQDVFTTLNQSPIDLPEIVVIGSQSSGKSSVLEGLVKRDFLPRGTGIVTRRPLVLQLYHTSKNSHPKLENENEIKNEDNNNNNNNDEDNNIDYDNITEWGEFLHLPGKIFYDFEKIKQEIQRETDRVAGNGKGISRQRIGLKIYSPNVLNLTLVDLPGITKVSIGDQPEDIEIQIRDMCLEYISNPRSIILAITSATGDLANSDSLSLAKEVDPDGDRTIGVLTKLDLMDPGTDALDILQNRVIPLRRGYIGVINRGQKDINSGLDINSALLNEERFFKTHKRYRNILDRCTTKILGKTLNHILISHIRNCLPEIRNTITNRMSQVKHELLSLGEPINENDNTILGGEMLGIISNFSSRFYDCIEGENISNDGRELAELFGGARIHYIFQEVYAKSLMQISPFDGLSDIEIRNVMFNANGLRPSLFVNEKSFHLLVKKQIARLEHPGLQCVELVFDEIRKILMQCETTELSRFPLFRERLMEVILNIMRKNMIPTQNMISNLINLELSFINTNHPDFIGNRAITKYREGKNRNNNNNNNNNVNNDNNNNDNDNDNNNNNDINNEDNIITTPKSINNKNLDNSHIHQNYEHRNKEKDIEKKYNNNQSQGWVSQFFWRKNHPNDIKNNHNNNNNINDFNNIDDNNNDNDINYTNRNNYDKIYNHNNMIKLPQLPESVQHPDNLSETPNLELIKILIRSYFDIVRKNILDLVPKAIMHFLVNNIKENLQNELIAILYNEDSFKLIREAPDIAQRRKECTEYCDMLESALDIINEVRDFNAFNNK